MQYEMITIHSNQDKRHLENLLHPIFMQDIFNNLKSTQELKEFILNSTNLHWFIFSDYCINDKNKNNQVMTFSIIAFENHKQHEDLDRVIKSLQPFDLKESNEINPNFLRFLNAIPIFNISYRLPENRNYTIAFDFNEIDFLKMRYESLLKYFQRLQGVPIQGLDFNNQIKDFKYILNKFKSKSIPLKLFRDIEIITSIVSSICILISQIHQNKKLSFYWASDRDSLISFEQKNLSIPLIFSMIHASFHSFLKTNNTIKFIQHDNQLKPITDNFNRIPDIIAGTLADMNNKYVSHKKYLPIIKNHLTLKSKNHIAQIYFKRDKYGVNTIHLKRK
ncbi:hypothetical protein ACOAMD_17235 [Acinetobacter baumannii]